MDPFNALSIAAAVVQFIDYATGILKDYRAIRKVGQPLTFEAFEQTTGDLLKLKATLMSRSRASGIRMNRPDGLAEDEKALNTMLIECGQIAQQLTDTLRSLRPKKIDHSAGEELAVERKLREAPQHKWTSFLQALQTTWKAEKIETLKARLTIYREQLVLRLLACLNSRVDFYGNRQIDAMQSLKENGAHIVEVLAFNQGEIRKLRAEFDETLELIKENHGEVMAAILTLSNGETHSVFPARPSKNTGAVEYEQSILRIGASHADSELTVSLGNFNFNSLQSAILNCLHFLQITDRIDDVKEAHRATFNWIFKKPDLLGKPWSDFPKWLETRDGCFWINGKAGSGKSTLMKFIESDTRTRDHLKIWAKNKMLLHASFFFWNLGTQLQKTQEGLLRSLLHDILRQHPQLITVVMPELCKESIKSQAYHRLAEPTLVELRRWFTRLVKYENSNLCLSFHIDGIDEYAGNPMDLIELIASSTSSRVKFLVSSRPIPACTDSFVGFPGLRLQDLTHADIAHYREDVLGKKLIQRNKDLGPVVEEIVEKSSGVFLWVILVVKSLLQGLQDGDTIKELLARLDDLPTELADLYAHMMHKIPLAYRDQASLLFQVYMNSRSIEQDIRGHPILAIQLWFVGQDWETVRTTPLKRMTRKEERDQTEEIDRRIRSRCCGIFELQKRKPRRKAVPTPLAHRIMLSQPIIRPHIEFIHKTVLEFLQDQEVWAEIKSWTDSNPYHALFRSCIMMAKSFSPTEVVHPRDNLIWDSMYTGLRYAQLAENKGDPLLAAHFDDFDSTLSQHWSFAETYVWTYPTVNREYQAPERFSTKSTGHWSTILFWHRIFQGDHQPDESTTCETQFRGLATEFDQTSFLEGSTQMGFCRVAIIYGLGSYIKARITANTEAGTDSQHLLRFWLNILTSPFPIRLRMPAGINFCRSILESATAASSPLQADDALQLWNIFLFELCMCQDLRDSLERSYTKETEWKNIAALAMHFLQQSGQRERPSSPIWSWSTNPEEFAHLLRLRLFDNSPISNNLILKTHFFMIIDWLERQSPKGLAQMSPTTPRDREKSAFAAAESSCTTDSKIPSVTRQSFWSLKKLSSLYRNLKPKPKGLNIQSSIRIKHAERKESVIRHRGSFYIHNINNMIDDSDEEVQSAYM